MKKLEKDYIVKLPWASGVTSVWMEENIGRYDETWSMSTGHGASDIWYYFLREKDATLFTLRWM